MNDAKLEIFNEDGSLRYSSERFLPIKFVGTFKIGTVQPIGKPNGAHTKWVFTVNLNIPPGGGNRRLHVLTPIPTVWFATTKAIIYAQRVTKWYPTPVYWDRVVADFTKDCYILELA